MKEYSARLQRQQAQLSQQNQNKEAQLQAHLQVQLQTKDFHMKTNYQVNKLKHALNAITRKYIWPGLKTEDILTRLG